MSSGARGLGTPWRDVERRSTIRLVVAVVAATAGALTAVLAGRGDAVLLVAPWIVLLAVGLPALRAPEVRADVTASADRVVAGDELAVTALVTAEPAAGWVAGHVDPRGRLWGERPRDEDGPRRTVSLGAAPLDGPGPVRLHTLLRADHWGSYDLGHLRLAVEQPYGLVRWSGSIDHGAQLRVHPSAAELRTLVTPRHVRGLSGAHTARTAARGVEFADLRPFGSGDSRRDINWAASVRSDRLWVSQRHPERTADLVLLVDSFVESGHDVRAAFGMAVEAAIGLAERHLAVTDRVGLVEVGGVLRWVTPRTGRFQLHQLTDALLATRLYANAARRDLSIVPPKALPPRSLVIGLSPLLDERFIETLRLLQAARHDVAVIECDPLPPDLGPSDRAASRLAWRLWHLERDITRDRLTAGGIDVSRWTAGTGLDTVLDDLDRRRSRSLNQRAVRA